ncbi:hypothetical protein, partial [Ralstonia pseudosolanacearum]|uniref:hypothetical protein n=1 Tax=Ralstonia pseudosolanacearum TaxID=1310165 RepID=UPI00197FE21B
AAETLTAQLAVYNHFASSNEKCRSGLTERHYFFGSLFLWPEPGMPHGFQRLRAAIALHDQARHIPGLSIWASGHARARAKSR